MFAWIAGVSTNQDRHPKGNYGIKGKASATNMPGGRTCGIIWPDKDNKNIINLFSGDGYDANGALGIFL
jgi:hypothetical protein